jgi:hypothetical protein
MLGLVSQRLSILCRSLPYNLLLDTPDLIWTSLPARGFLRLRIELLSEGLDDLRFVIAFDVTVPLPSLSRLTKLDLSRFCTSAVNDGALKRMARS